MDAVDPTQESIPERSEWIRKNDTLRREIARLRAECDELRSRVKEAESTTVASREFRHAALNLMEDAVAARGAAQRAGEAARESEERFRAILSQTTAAIGQTNEQGEFLFANLECRTLTGYSEDELLGMTIIEITHPEDQPRHRAMFERMLQDGMPFAIETRFLRKDGSIVWVHNSVAGLLNLNGKVTGAITVSVNVTERKIAEHGLRESENRMRTLADAVPQIIWANDCHGHANYFNQRWYEYSGINYEEAAGPGWQRIVHPDDEGNAVQAWRMALEQGNPFEAEFRLRRHDGIYRWFICRSVPTLGEEGTIISWFGSATDIDDLKQAEAAVEKSRTELFQALQETEQARAEAEAAGKAKDNFLAILSHELRTPLTPILIATHSLLRRKDTSGQMREALDMIRRNVEIEARFVDDLLDVTRISRGKLELVIQPMDLHEAIRHAIDIAKADLEAKEQKLTVRLDAANHHLAGDSSRLQQVVWNLLKNASKFTPSGGDISIGTRNVGDRLILEITDTGIGISLDAMRHIFNAFSQADAQIAREFGGLGLGLAIAKASVEGHGGELTVRSDGANKGATFVVSLPLAHRHTERLGGKRPV